VHLDGARLANALAFLGCTPAEATWKAGIDVLSLGATKNGAMGAEALVFFDPALAAEAGFRRKRAGHLLSKQRFVSAQLDAWLTGGLWLRLAAEANARAARLAAGLAGIPGAVPAHPVEINEVFVTLPEPVIERLLARGFSFYRWDGALVRLVTSFATRIETVDALLAAAADPSENDGAL
jgi:threonine aldolase